MNNRTTARIATLTALIVLVLAGQASADTFWGLTTANTLVRFSSTDPGHPDLTLPITGLADGERLIAIAIHDKEGTFFGLSSTGRLYTADRTTGAMTPFAAQTGRIIVSSGTAFGMALHERQIMDNFVFEVTSNTGQRIEMRLRDGVAGVLQLPLPSSVHVVTIAHRFGWSVGPIIGVDSSTDRLITVSTPGGLGTPPTVGDLGPLGIDISDEAGMTSSFYDRLHVYAALTVHGVPGLYQLSEDGTVTPLGVIGSAPLTSLAADHEALTIAAPLPYDPATGRFELREGTSSTFVLRRAGDVTTPVDYLVTSGKVTVALSRVHFAAGQYEQTLTVTYSEDDVREGYQGQTASIRFEEDRAVAPYGRWVEFDAVDNDNQRPVLTVTTPSASSVFALADTMTISGLVTDDRPGTVVYLVTDYELPPLGMATGNPWTFENVPTTAYYSTFLNVVAVDSDGAQTRTRLHVLRGENQMLALAEGATGSFFHTDLLFANPASIDVPVTIDFLRPDGSTVSHALTVPAYRSATLDVASVPEMEATAAATVVRGVGTIGVERTMRWDASGYGASTERAAPAFSPTWHFAEGSQGFFSTFLLLVNPQTTNNLATVQFLRESGGPVIRTYTLAPRARLTIDAGAIPELVNQSFGIDVAFAQPAMAERSMYFGQTPLWTGGHASAGAAALSTDWFLAEGATGSFFKTFVLAANPSNQPADVTFTFLPSSGAPVVRTKQIPANGRLTVNIEQEDPALANAAVGTRVSSSVPIVVERSQYWPGSPDRWYEAHNSVGQTAASQRWLLAEGRSGGPDGYQTYILLANPDPVQEAHVGLTFLRDDGPDVVGRSVSVPPASRVTVSVDPSQIPELTNARFGTSITSTVPIVVERSMYWNANGQFWAAGTNAAAARPPF
jgi:hypothetical protein